MFIQVIEGHLKDEAGARQAMDRWTTDLAPGAVGWLGGTYGTTDDGDLVAVVRFDSAESARANSDRPEQSSWWAQMAACFDGDVTFHDCPRVEVMGAGGSDQAGFVQLIEGKVKDPDSVMRMWREDSDMLAAMRPDVIGATVAFADDGWCCQTVAFTSEEEARVAEKQEMPPEVAERMQSEMAMVEDLRFVDLHHPWFASKA